MPDMQEKCICLPSMFLSVFRLFKCKVLTMICILLTNSVVVLLCVLLTVLSVSNPMSLHLIEAQLLFIQQARVFIVFTVEPHWVIIWLLVDGRLSCLYIISSSLLLKKKPLFFVCHAFLILYTMLYLQRWLYIAKVYVY